MTLSRGRLPLSLSLSKAPRIRSGDLPRHPRERGGPACALPVAPQRDFRVGGNDEDKSPYLTARSAGSVGSLITRSIAAQRASAPGPAAFSTASIRWRRSATPAR